METKKCKKCGRELPITEFLMTRCSQKAQRYSSIWATISRGFWSGKILHQKIDRQCE